MKPFYKIKLSSIIFIALLYFCVIGCTHETIQPNSGPIDRKSLVDRHRVIVESADSLSSLSVGNGEFAFTVDVSGLQSFPEYYESGVSLGTQSQWGWHRKPNKGKYDLAEVLESFETCNDHNYPVATQHKAGRKKEATDYLRANPHRLHLGLVGLDFVKKDGTKGQISDLKNIHQELNLWTGSIISQYEFEGQPVRVELYCHQEEDAIAFKIESPLIQQSRLKLNVGLPYGKECHVCPGYDFNRPDLHTSSLTKIAASKYEIDHQLDGTQYSILISSEMDGKCTTIVPHHFQFLPDTNQSEFSAVIHFRQETETKKVLNYGVTKQNSHKAWKNYWMSGAAVDFSDCSDPRANELERRVVLSSYLTKIQCAGSLPPQETGLTFNSWYGKFHLEMHWWHGVHFALWNHIDQLEKSLWWYEDVMPEAKKTALRQGFKGVRWQKMTGPEGQSSPSSVGEFLAWQQPHPIYFAELVYRQKPDTTVLNRYKQIVFETADFMASFAFYHEADGYYHLCHPLIPAQEIFHATETDDPPFEVAYWHFALTTAQNWRKRIGLEPNADWQRVIDKLVPLHQFDDYYLPAARATKAYTDIELRRDHPIVTGAYGMLPGTPKLDTSVMRRTFQEIMREWNWETTWGWDYPMLAMCAARLGDGDAAIDALLLDVQKNTYLKNGHNYQDPRLRIYLPGNGGLLTAVAMMAAGWDDGPKMHNPGFPQDGTWNVKWEGLEIMP